MAEDELHPGMKVVGANGGEVGTIKEVRGDSFLVDRRMQRDVWVPLSAVAGTLENNVTLNIVADRVGDMNWPQPPLPGERQLAD
jgi:hypothetical protein